MPEFKGLASEDLKLKYELNKLRLETTSTLNEQLVEEGKEKIKTGILINGKDIADLPALTNTVVSQFYKGQIKQDQQKEQMAQQQAMAAQQAGEQGGEAQPGQEQAPELSEADRKLIEEFGAPE